MAPTQRDTTGRMRWASTPPRWLGVLVPLVFIGITVAVALYLGRPWHYVVDADGTTLESVLLWAGFTVVLCVPYALACVVLLTGRRWPILWWTAFGYTVVAGLFAVIVDVDAVTDESSTAALALPFTLLYQLVILLPAAIVVGVLWWVVVRLWSRCRSEPVTRGESQTPLTGEKFDRG